MQERDASSKRANRRDDPIPMARERNNANLDTGELGTMTTILDAGYTYSSDGDGVVTVGFADQQYDTQRYLLLQRSKNPSGQDQKLEHDQVHITIDDQSRSTYGGIRRIEIQPVMVKITLTTESAQQLGTDREIVVRFRVSHPDQTAAVARLREIFADNPSVMR